MSTPPRRSLRLRSWNMPEESIEPDKRMAVTSNTRKGSVPLHSGEITKGDRTRETTKNKHVLDKVDGTENEPGKEKEEEFIMDDDVENGIQLTRKRSVSMVEKKEESNEEEATEKDTVPAKTRRIDPKSEDKVTEVKDDKKDMKTGTVVQSNGRPRRGCVKRATVKQYDGLISGSASSSDITSSESDVNDSDLEREIRKAKKRREDRVSGGKGKKGEISTQESSSDSLSDDEEAEEEEEEMVVEEPHKKRGGTRGGFSSSRNGGSSGNRRKRTIQRSKMEMNDLPREILRHREYDVDYDEMVAWEAKSVKMVRDLRVLERDRANGGQIMDTVNEFIERCLRSGRLTEMDEKESIRVTHDHEEQVEEMNRKKKMSVTQRIKEVVQNEKKLLEEEKDEESEEDEWEEMETVDDKEEKGNGKVEVMVEIKKKLKAPWKAKWIRQEINREVRQRSENIHKVHLVSYIAHVRHLMSLAMSHTRADGGIPLAARSLSLIPTILTKMMENRVDGEMMIDELIEWWRKEYSQTDENMEGMSENEILDELMENHHFKTSKEAAILFSSLASHLNFSFRIVARCEVVTKKPKENASVVKKAVKNKKVEDKTAEKRSTTEEQMTYWCELWNEKERSWRVIDPFNLSSESGEKKETKIGKKKKDKQEGEQKYGKDMISDFVKSWNSSTHVEPFNSCMEKDGPVLYFIAVDNNFGIRDVSSRYINGKDVISRELRGRRANEEWLMELWENKAWKSDGIKTNEENEEWREKVMKMEMPKTVAAFKDHPLYVLDKDVLKMQIIFPYDTKPIGEINKYKIYLRKFVHPINTAKWYEKMGRQIKRDEPPCGEKLVTNPLSGETGTVGLYGFWQTERWNGGEVIEGRIPRNEFGNVYMYQPEMIPRGCLYLIPEGIQRVATELRKDFVPAVVAWYYKGGTTIPLIRGAVFIKEDLPELLEAWKVSYKRWKAEERKARTDRCIGRWKKLMKGMLRLAAMRKEFAPFHNKVKGTTLDEDAVRVEENASWPQKKYGGEMFNE